MSKSPEDEEKIPSEIISIFITRQLVLQRKPRGIGTESSTFSLSGDELRGARTSELRAADGCVKRRRENESRSHARILCPVSEHLASSSPQLHAHSDTHQHKLYLVASPWISGPTRSPDSNAVRTRVNPPPCVREPQLSSSPGFNTADQWTEPPQRPAALQTRRKQ
ncbi:unnamed protein product [Pleuronectes platessa]|uniref:Uncharacterized protein n=1 Tax=Pleuronectes platessa TaxID=8262 RepID=A0A9N7YFC1_PLEPL|nr:unnamed protein product [Pleuronectes platessa]